MAEDVKAMFIKYCFMWWEIINNRDNLVDVDKAKFMKQRFLWWEIANK